MPRVTEPVRGVSLLQDTEGSCLVSIWDKEVWKDAPLPEEMGSFFLGKSGPEGIEGALGVREG